MTIKPSKIEEFLRLPPGSFDHIPHYARNIAIEAIHNVMELERKQLFRPGLYYILLSDLCRSTEASRHLGANLNRSRVETFIVTCIEALGSIELENYAMFLREIGDAVLILFSSFRDILEWHETMSMYLAKRDQMWQHTLERNQIKHFKLEAKTVVHAGEVLYSDNNRPVALTVNQIFKVEKLFKGGELGVTQTALVPIIPILKDTIFTYRRNADITLPGDRESTKTYKIVVKKKRLRPTRRSSRRAEACG